MYICILQRRILGFIPYGENNRYDFIADINGKLIRVQVKTSSSKDGGKTYAFSCKSSRTNGKRTVNKRYDKSEIDFFATFINGECYLIPVEECSSSKALRFEACDNNQTTYVNFAEEYKLDTQLKNLAFQFSWLEHVICNLETPVRIRLGPQSVGRRQGTILYFY